MEVSKIVKIMSVLASGGTQTMTNYNLTREVVDSLPVDWNDPTIKILDPHCGKGTFLLACAEKLYEHGHAPKHIVSKMLHGIDIDEVQILTTKRALQHFCDVDSNVEIKDYLQGNNMEFDIVIGNPPFQTNTELASKRQGGLWFEFLKKSAEVLKSGGTMAFVSPRWTGAQTRWMDWFKQFHMTHICFDAKKYFPKTGSSFCWYVLKKDSKGTTKVMDLDFEFDLNKTQMLPYHVSPENISILNKVLKTNKGSEYGFKRTFPAGPSEMKEMGTYLFEEDGRSRTNEGKRKVYCINGRFIEAKYIKIDATGHTEDSWKASMPLKCKEVVGARSVFTSKLAHHLWNIMGAPEGKSQTGILQKCMPIVDLTEKWTDEELYQEFGLTKKEIEYVESY